MQTLLFRNIRIVDAEKDFIGSLLVQDGKIQAVGGAVDVDEPATTVIEGKGRVLMPAFVDLHAHFRDPGFLQKEDIHTGCRAAVHGGYTTVNLMANTKPVCSLPETVKYVRDKAAELGICDVFQTTSITEGFDGETLTHLEHLEESVRWISDDGVGVKDTAVMLKAMEIAKEKKIGLMLHEEDAALTHVNAYLMEDIPTYRDVELALLTGCHLHFCHVSTIGSMNHIREGKRRGAPVTCEVTPHHLYLNDTNGGRVAPPLRGEEHRQYLIQCVKEGLVDAIATDHAPHTPQDKQAGMNGFTGLDLAFSTCYTVLVKGGHISLMELSRLMSANPARLMRVEKGMIEEGLPADLVLVDPNASYTVDESHIHSKSKNTPLLGETLDGEIVMTLKEGTIVYGKAD